jgi:structure-specific endonuclease subunit SLX1
LPVVADFSGPAENILRDQAEEPAQPGLATLRGIHTLPVDYEPIRDYVAKGKDVFDFERQGSCIICHEAMAHGEGIYAICTNSGCEGVGHLDCWSRHMLPSQDGENILPMQGTCPKCQGPVSWGGMMTELTLRLRGAKEVDGLLKKKKRGTSAKT